MKHERTIGERLFEDYLNEMQYPYEFEKEYEGHKQRPDYTVTKDGVFLFDVKDFDPYMPLGVSAHDPYPRIREKIDSGRKKFKGFKDLPCCIVLRNNGNAFVDIEFPAVVLGAMYGDSGFTMPFDPAKGRAIGPPTRAFLPGRGKMIRDPNHIQNSTISALLTLRYVGVGLRRLRKIWREFPGLSVDEAIQIGTERFPMFDAAERKLGVIVWENAVARIPLSRHLFTGRYDERWGVDGDDQKMVFRGEELAALTSDE
jgi:hypothetical protein